MSNLQTNYLTFFTYIAFRCIDKTNGFQHITTSYELQIIPSEHALIP